MADQDGGAGATPVFHQYNHPTAAQRRTPRTAAQQRIRKRRRLKPPQDSKTRKAALAYIALRAQGVGTAEISEMLGLAVSTLRSYVQISRDRGWLTIDSFAEPEDRIDFVLKSKAVQNINTILDEKVKGADGTEYLTVRAGDTAIEVAKGTGLFKQHQQVKSDQTSSIAVALRVDVNLPVFQTPNAEGSALQVRAGTTGGAPFVPADAIDVEVLD